MVVRVVGQQLAAVVLAVALLGRVTAQQPPGVVVAAARQPLAVGAVAA
jgi:hypothetical protein